MNSTRIPPKRAKNFIIDVLSLEPAALPLYWLFSIKVSEISSSTINEFAFDALRVKCIWNAFTSLTESSTAISPSSSSTATPGFLEFLRNSFNTLASGDFFLIDT